MADRYWVGGSATWDSAAGTKWSATSAGAGGASVPTSADDVYFDAGSGSSSVSIQSGGMPSRALTVTNNYTGSLSGTVLAHGSVSVGDNFQAGNLSITFSMTGGSATIKSPLGAYSFYDLVINAPSATITTANALKVSSFKLYQGSFVAAHNINTGSFETSGTGVRSLNYGTSGSVVWDIGGSGAVWYCDNLSNFTMSGNAAVQIRFISAFQKTFFGGGLSYPIVVNAASSSLVIFNNNTFAELTNSAIPSAFAFGAGSTQTISNFNVNGTAGNLVFISSWTPGSRANLSKSSGTVSASYLSISDSNATGGAAWYAANSTDSGNNLGWIFSAPPVGNMLAMFM
jgi:hypothetical protein